MSSLWEMVNDLKGQFKLKSEVNEDNSAFKLVSKISVGYCILATLLLAANTYVGDPIECKE